MNQGCAWATSNTVHRSTCRRTSEERVSSLILRPDGFGTGLNFRRLISPTGFLEQGSVVLQARRHIRVIGPKRLFLDLPHALAVVYDKHLMDRSGWPGVVVKHVRGEASGIDDPVIWTDKRDREMWAALQGG